MNSNLIINISGLGYSGSTAIRDALLEYSEISHFNSSTKGYPEYNFIGDPGGLLDIYAQLEENWNYLSSINTLRRNRELFNDIKPKRSRIHPYGLHLNKYSKTKVDDIYDRFIQNISIFEFFLDSRINYLTKDRITRFIDKIQRRVLLNRPKIDFLLNPSKENFLINVKAFHEDVFHSFETQKVLVEKAIPVYNLATGHDFFNNIKTIVVIRNPADILVEMYSRKTAIFKGNSFLSSLKIEEFLNWQKIYLFQLCELQNRNDLLIISFELLINHSSEVLRKVEYFLDIKNRPLKFTKFIPEKSIVNINKYKDILTVEQQLQVLRSETYKLYVELSSNAKVFI